jgi:hypothetical protein
MKKVLGLFVFFLATAWAQNQQIGSFQYVESIDPMTDVDTSFILTEDPEGTRMRTGGLAWRCMDDGLNVVLFADEYLGSRDPAQVRWRFDSQEVTPLQRWLLSTRGTAAFAPMGEIANFTRNALEAARVVMQVTDFGDRVYTYTYMLDGLEEALGLLTCASDLTE